LYSFSSSCQYSAFKKAAVSTQPSAKKAALSSQHSAKSNTQNSSIQQSAKATPVFTPALSTVCGTVLVLPLFPLLLLLADS
jgi:hypothetical protein